jgi:hypothetical protein
MRYINGDEFRGMFSCDARHGSGMSLSYRFHQSDHSLSGTMYYSNGECYDGNWNQGNRDGHGTYWYETSSLIYRSLGTDVHRQVFQRRCVLGRVVQGPKKRHGLVPL